MFITYKEIKFFSFGGGLFGFGAGVSSPPSYIPLQEVKPSLNETDSKQNYVPLTDQGKVLSRKLCFSLLWCGYKTPLLADAFKNESKVIEETDESTKKFVLAGLGPNNDMEIEVTLVDPDKSTDSSYLTRR